MNDRNGEKLISIMQNFTNLKNLNLQYNFFSEEVLAQLQSAASGRSDLNLQL